MSFKIGVTIGAVFAGAGAFSSSQKAIALLERNVIRLNSRKLDFKTKGSLAELTAVNKKLKQTNTAINKINSRKLKINTILDKRQAFKSSIFEKVAIGASIALPFKVAIDFESSMADVKKVVNFSSEKELAKFSRQITKLSQTIPLSASELATITASGGQLGIAKANLLDFTQVTAKMSTAFDMMPEATGNASAKLMNIFRLNVQGVSRLGDAINHLSDNSAAKASDMIDVIARTGAGAKDLGLTSTQVASLASTFLSLGRPSQVAGTAINAMLLKLGNAQGQGKKFHDALATMGISVSELQTNLDNDPEGSFINFFESLNQLEKYDKMAVLSDLFGMEYADDISLLAGSLDIYKKSISLLADEQQFTGSMQREFAERSKTTANNLRLLGNAIHEISINFSTLLIPALNSVLDFGKSVGRMVASFVSEFPNLSKVVGGVIVGLMSFGLVLSVVGYAWGFAKIGGLKFLNMLTFGKAALIGTTIATKALTAAQLVFNAALKANPIGLLITGIATLVAGAVMLYKNFEPFRNLIDAIWGRFKKFFAGVLDGVKQVGDAISSVVGFLGFGGDKNSISKKIEIAHSQKPFNPRAITGRNASTRTGQINQAVDMKVVVNNPTNNVEVEKALVAGMARVGSGVAFADENI